MSAARLLSQRVRTRRAGRSARRHFRQLRWQALRRNWRDWLALVAFTAACALWIVAVGGASQLVAAALIGSMVTLALFAWMAGGDAHSLPWLWGSFAERWTAEALEELGESWRCEHDLVRERGNWDHVVVSRAGVFLVDTKRLSQPGYIAGDALVSGRVRYAGAGFRAAAAAVAEMLKERTGYRPWVQPVVAVWGDLRERTCEANGVHYVRADALIAWLRAQPRASARHALGGSQTPLLSPPPPNDERPRLARRLAERSYHPRRGRQSTLVAAVSARPRGTTAERLPSPVRELAPRASRGKRLLTLIAFRERGRDTPE